MLTDKNSTWPDHRNSLLELCFHWGVTLQELADAVTRMTELSASQREDLLSRAGQLLRF